MLQKKISLSIIIILSITSIIAAQETELEKNGIWNREFLAGDLYGTRNWLEGPGISLEITYTGEMFSNLRGGINTSGASEYRGNFDLVLTADPEKLGLAPGTIYFYAQNGHGNGISERHVGDTQTLSNLDACYLSQVSEYWIEQLFFDERLRIKVGKQDSNADFVAVDYGGIFIGSSEAVIPNIPMPTFPDPALGIALHWDITNWVSIGGGFYEGSPVGCHAGFDTAFGNNGGSFSIGELALRSLLGKQKDLPGTYRFGGWYHSSDFEDVGEHTGIDPKVYAGNHGFYLAFDQMLYREDDVSDQGLVAFFQLGMAPEDRNELDRYLGIGLNYVGLFEGRDEDVVGLGIAQASWSDRVEDISSETAIEFFYRAQLTNSIAIQPDIQYIVNPGGNGEDALALGVRFQITF